MDRAGREGEAEAGLLEATQHAEADRLLHVHEDVVLGAEHPVDELQLQRRVSEALEVSAVEARVVRRLHRLAHQARGLLERVRRGVELHSELGHDPALAHALVVPDAALDEVLVGEDELLAAERPDAGGPETDLVDGAHLVADDDEVAEIERTIEVDREKRSPRMFCTASAAAMPPMPSPAISVVISTPRFDSAMRSTTVQSTS